MSEPEINVKGLKDFRRELAKLAGEGPGLLKEANIKTATFVADMAKGRAAGVSRQAAKAAGTLRPVKSGVAARISGGTGIGFFYGAEFGSNRYHQFMPHGGTTGYFLYPTIRGEMDVIVNFYGDEIERVSRRAFPD